MSTAAIAGFDGSVSGPTGASEVKDFTINLTTEALDTTSFDSGGYREFIEGLKGATGSFTSQGTAPVSRGICTATFKTKSSGGATIAGSILVSQAAVSTPVEGVVTCACDFSFTGSITIS